jgi:sugar phosphate permease
MNSSNHAELHASDGKWQSATHIRYLVVALATAMSFLLYMDRFCLPFVERYIKEDLGLSNAQNDWLLAAFFGSYALAQVPAGWLSDRFGARLMLSLYIFLWSLFTGLMGVLVIFVALLVFRLGCGAAQAGAYPTSGSILSKWVAFSERGVCSSIIALGGRVGGAVVSVTSAYLIVALLPSDASSLLNREDLLDPAGFQEQFQFTDIASLARSNALLRELLPPAALDSLLKTPTDDEGVDSLVEGLNAVLRRRDLYEHINPDEFELEREARQLAKVPDKNLTQSQIERRNRLWLEAACPTYFRKLYGMSWRYVIIVYGAVGLLIALAFWLGYRDRPRDHPSVNSAEIAVIEGGRPAGVTKPHGRVSGLPMAYILRSRSLWCSSLSQFGTNVGWIFVLALLPRYLIDAHSVPVVERGWMAFTPPIVGIVGMFCGGWLTDRLVRAIGVRWGRGLPMALTRFTAMIAYLVCLLLHEPWPIVIVLSLVTLSVDMGTPALWAFMQDVGGQHVGSVLGWGNMWGNFGAMAATPFLAWIAREFGWDKVFLACAAAFFVSGAAALFVDATIPIAPAEEK